MPQTVSIKKGLDLPIAGVPDQQIVDGPRITRVGLLGDDYIGLKPTMVVREGDTVKRGQVLFTDKKLPAVCYTSPVAGRVASIARGAKRAFDALIVDVAGDEGVDFGTFGEANYTKLPADQVRGRLLQSGLWTALRTRPYSKVANPDTSPFAVFITAMDTSPLAVDPRLVIAKRDRDFFAGLQVLSTLTAGKTYLCRAPGEPLPGEDQKCVETHVFSGPHPAGLPGTHIHFLAPAALDRLVWYVNYQDVLAIGHLFLTGQFDNRRVVSLAGPAAVKPRLVRTVLGADLAQLTKGEVRSDLPHAARIISGSVLSGRKLAPPHEFLGRYHLQVSLLEEGYERELLGWAGPGFGKFSLKPIFAGALGGGRFPLTTSTQGSHRAIVPSGMYERVMPLDIIPTALLKSLAIGDTDMAQALGAIELDEEDLSLCTFVCTGKIDYGPLLRKALAAIEADG